MKKISYLFAFLFFVNLLTFTSCTTDSDTEEEIISAHEFQANGGDKKEVNENTEKDD